MQQFLTKTYNQTKRRLNVHLTEKKQNNQDYWSHQTHRKMKDKDLKHNTQTAAAKAGK